MAADSKQVVKNQEGNSKRQGKWKRVIILDYDMRMPDTIEGLAKPYRQQGIAVHNVTISSENKIAWPENLPLIDKDDKIITFAHGAPAQEHIQSHSTQTLLSAAELAEIIASHTQKNVERLSISHLSCLGGLGLQAYSPHGSFAAHLLHLLREKGIKNPIITALRHILLLSSTGPKQTLSVLNFPLPTTSSENGEINLTHINNVERYMGLNFGLEKLPGSKVRLSLSQDDREELIVTYPYGESQIMKVYELNEDDIKKSYPPYAAARDKIKNEAIKALADVLAEAKKAAEASGLVIPSAIGEPIFKVMPKELSHLYFFDSRTIINFIEKNNKNRSDKEISPAVLNWEKDVKDKIAIRPELSFYLSQQEVLFSILKNAVEKMKIGSGYEKIAIGSDYEKINANLLTQLNYFAGSNIPNLIISGIRALHENERYMDRIDREAFLALSEKGQHQLAILVSIDPQERDKLCEPFSEKLNPIIGPINFLKKIIKTELNAQALRGETLEAELIVLSKLSTLHQMKEYVEKAKKDNQTLPEDIKEVPIDHKTWSERVLAIFKLIQDSDSLNEVEMEIQCDRLKAMLRFYTLKAFIKAELNENFEEEKHLSAQLSTLVNSRDLAEMKERAALYLQKMDDKFLTKKTRRICAIIVELDSIEKIEQALRFDALKEFIKAKFKENSRGHTALSTSVRFLLESQNLAEMKERAKYHLKTKSSLTPKTRMVCQTVMDFDSIEDIGEALQGKIDIKRELFNTIKDFFKPEMKQIIETHPWDAPQSPQRIDLRNLQGLAGYRLKHEKKPHPRAKIVYDIISTSGSLEAIRDGILFYRLKTLIKHTFQERSRQENNPYVDPMASLLQAGNLAEMKACAKASLQKGNVLLTEKTRSVCAMVVDLDSIEEIRKAILFYIIRELIKEQFKEDYCKLPSVRALINAQNLAEMKKEANSYLKEAKSDLAEKVKQVCQTVTVFDSIEKIKEVLSFHALKEVIKHDLKELKGHYSYVDLLLKARNLDELYMQVQYFLNNKDSLPERIKIFCVSLASAGSLAKIKEALKSSAHLDLVEERHSIRVASDASSPIHSEQAPLFFPFSAQVERVMAESEEGRRLHGLKELIETELNELKYHSFHVDKLATASNLEGLITCANSFLSDSNLPIKLKIFCEGVAQSHSIDAIQEAIQLFTLKDFIRTVLKEDMERVDYFDWVVYLLCAPDLAAMRERADNCLKLPGTGLTEKASRVFQIVREHGSIDDIKNALYRRLYVEKDLFTIIQDLFIRKWKDEDSWFIFQTRSGNNLLDMKYISTLFLQQNTALPEEIKSVLKNIIDYNSIEEIRERILLDKLKEFIKVELIEKVAEEKHLFDQALSLLTAKSLDKMKECAAIYIRAGGNALTAKTRMVAALGSIDEITMAISFYTIKEHIQTEMKKNGIEGEQFFSLLSSLVEAQDLAEMKRLAQSHLQYGGIGLSRKVKKICEIITDFESIEKIEEALFFHALQEIIKSKLNGLEGTSIYAGLLMSAHNLERLKKCAQHFLKNTSDLPQEVKMVCESVAPAHSIAEIEAALQFQTHLALRVQPSMLAVDPGPALSLNAPQSTSQFFQPLPQDEPGVAPVKSGTTSLEPRR
ncbi:MAG: hypothetical protein K0R48_59 [Gammaproteobacteria bacterium]|nr:hypothetical protein [Gammaproteobacteria bacterium]